MSTEENNKFDESSAFAGLEGLVENKADDTSSNNADAGDSANSLEGLFDESVIKGEATGSPEAGSEAQAQEQAQASEAAAAQAAAAETEIELTEAHRSKLLNEMFGDKFTSIDEVKESFKLLDEVPSLRERSTKLQEQLEDKYNPFANEEVARFNHFVKETGINDMKVYAKVSSIGSETDPIDVLVTQHVVENPEYAGQEGKLKNFLVSKYGLDPEKYDEEELENNKFALQLESSKALKSIEALKSKITEFKPVDFEALATQKEEQAKQEQQKLASGWSEIVAKLPEHIPAFKVDLGEGKGEFEYAYTAEQKKSIEKDVLDYLVGYKLPMTKESVQSALSFAQNRVYQSNQKEIYKSFAEKISNDIRAQYDKEFVNPSALNKGNQETEKKPDKTDADKAFELAMKGI
jgi:hypothetical protein